MQAEEEAHRAEEQQRLLEERRALIRQAAPCVSIVDGIVIAGKSDGTLLWAGEASSDKEIWNQYRETALSWKNISQVVGVEKGHTQTFGVIGVRMDGSVVLAGKNPSFLDEDKWTDLTAVVHTKMESGLKYKKSHDVFVGLKRDGHVTLYVTNGDELNRELEKLSEWNSLTKIISGENYIAGLKSDGTVVYVDNNWRSNLGPTTKWTGIVDIAALGKDIIGLKEDGTVAVTGYTSSEQKRYSDWTEIAALGSSGIGIKCDGTVVAEVYNKSLKEHLSAWTDIVAVFGDFLYIVGVKRMEPWFGPSDGRMILRWTLAAGSSSITLRPWSRSEKRPRDGLKRKRPGPAPSAAPPWRQSAPPCKTSLPT